MDGLTFGFNPGRIVPMEYLWYQILYRARTLELAPLHTHNEWLLYYLDVFFPENALTESLGFFAKETILPAGVKCKIVI